MINKGNNKIDKYNLLLLGPHFNCEGGVADFCNILYKSFSSTFYVDYLETGANSNNESLVKRLYNLIYNAYKLVKRLKNNNYHIVQLNPSFKIYSLLRDSLYLFIISQVSYKTDIAVFFHGWNSKLAEKIANSSPCKKLFVSIYKRSSIIFVLYNKCKKQLIDIGIDPQKIKVMKTFYKRVCKEQCKEKDKDDKINILFMSRFVKGKGVETSIEVAKFLVDNGYKNFRLTLAGDGPLLPLAKDYVKKYGLDDYVNIPGYVKGKEKIDLLNKSDIFILPTWLQEGCPISIIEAMGSGLAVISTSVGSIPEIIKNGEDGFVCDSKNPLDFCYIVKMLLDNEELMKKVQISAKKKAEENFEINSFMKKFEDDYLSLIGRSS